MRFLLDNAITLATDTTFRPFEYTDETGTLVGIDVDILAAIAEDQGFTVVTFEDSPSVYMAVSGGQCAARWATGCCSWTAA